MKLGALAALAIAGPAAAQLQAPVRVTLDGVAGVHPGLSVAAVAMRWGVALRPDYSASPDCGPAELHASGIDGYAVFWPRGRFAGVFFGRGAVTGRGIRIGSTLAQLRRAYPKTTSRAHRYLHGTRMHFVRRRAAPHWELRIDVGPNGRVTRIVFGTHDAVRLEEACA